MTQRAVTIAISHPEHVLKSFIVRSGNSLLDIQREEAQRAARERATAQASGAPPASGWAKVAAGTSASAFFFF